MARIASIPEIEHPCRLRTYGDEHLLDAIKSCSIFLFQLRNAPAASSYGTHWFRTVRRQIARLRTILSERATQPRAAELTDSEFQQFVTVLPKLAPAGFRDYAEIPTTQRLLWSCLSRTLLQDLSCWEMLQGVWNGKRSVDLQDLRKSLRCLPAVIEYRRSLAGLSPFDLDRVNGCSKSVSEQQLNCDAPVVEFRNRLLMASDHADPSQSNWVFIHYPRRHARISQSARPVDACIISPTVSIPAAGTFFSMIDDSITIAAPVSGVSQAKLLHLVSRIHYDNGQFLQRQSFLINPSIR